MRAGMAPHAPPAPHSTTGGGQFSGDYGGGGNDGGGTATGRRGGESTANSLRSSSAPVSSSFASSPPSSCSQPLGGNDVVQPPPPQQQAVATTETCGTTASQDLTSSTSESGWESGMVDEVAAAAADAAAAAAAAAFSADSNWGYRGGSSKVKVSPKTKGDAAVRGRRGMDSSDLSLEKGASTSMPKVPLPHQPPENAPEAGEFPLTAATASPSSVELHGPVDTENGGGRSGNVGAALKRSSFSASVSSVNGGRSWPSSPTPRRGAPSPDESGQHPEVASPRIWAGKVAETASTARDANGGHVPTRGPGGGAPPAGVEGVVGGRHRRDREFHGRRQRSDVRGGVRKEGTIVGARGGNVRPSDSGGSSSAIAATHANWNTSRSAGRERSSGPEYVAKVHLSIISIHKYLASCFFISFLLAPKCYFTLRPRPRVAIMD